MTIQAGILFSSHLLQSGWFRGLAAFVAINTIIYAILAISKLLPRRRA